MRTVIRVLILALLALGLGVSIARERQVWVASWVMSPAGMPTSPTIGSYPLPQPEAFTGTLRYRVRLAAGGKQVRVRFSNEYSETPVQIIAASFAIAGAGLDMAAGSMRPLTFSGRRSIVLPGGAPGLSDPLELEVAPHSDVIVSVYVGTGARVTGCQSPIGPPDEAAVDGSDATVAEHLPPAHCISSRPVISEVDVSSQRPRNVIVAFGDSITDGKVDPATGDRGWPGELAHRVQERDLVVVDAGIGGNRLLSTLPMFGAAALARFDRDVLAVPGLRYLIVLEGINDIGMSGPGGMLGDAPLAQPEELTAAYSQLIERAHEHGIKVFGGTLLPFESANYYTEPKERVRSAVNEWIRTSGQFDGVIDFDAVMRDPDHPRRMKAEFDSGDHLHPSPAGYRAMGRSIDPLLFR